MSIVKSFNLNDAKIGKERCLFGENVIFWYNSAMNNLIVSTFAEKKLKAGQQRLEARDFPEVTQTDELVYLFGHSGRFLGTAYLSSQHKGIGWLISETKQAMTRSFFVDLFTKARQKRQSFETDVETTAYRLFNQDGDNFGGLTIDLYGDFAVFSWYNTFVYHYKDVIVAAFREVYADCLGAYEKIRFKGLNYESAHLYGQEAPGCFTVLENGVRYQVFMNDGLMTGIFLDQHDVRRELVSGLSRGQKVLNMFSYTAAFSVAAAMGGAQETTSVDLAKRSKDLSEAHFKANHLDLSLHRFVVMDVFDYFKYAKRHNLVYDMIILDPPSFARNKKQTFSVAKDYHRLIAQSLDILSPKGVIIASTNASNLSVSQFQKELEKGFGNTKHTYLSLKQLPSDFTTNKNDESSNYLKVFTIKVDL